VTYDPDMTISYDYSYDDNGNLATKIKHSGGPDETTTYSYDYENRLTTVTLPDLTTNTFVYDGDKRRISRTNAAEEATKFFYDGINILKDYDDGGAELASYVQGVGIDSLISRKEGAEVRYYHADALGSTRTMTDATESATATYEYDAWGKLTAHTGEDTNEYKFTARRFEEEIGLQYNRARFYDPEIGRWTTQDPLTGGPDDPTISYFSGVYSFFHRFIKQHIDALQPNKHNRYVYCYNNPINLTDPLGLQVAEDETKKLGEETKKEQQGEKKAESAGKPKSTGTEQKGQTAQEVKRTNDAGKKDDYKGPAERNEEYKGPVERNEEYAGPTERNEATPSPAMQSPRETLILVDQYQVQLQGPVGRR